MDQAQTVRTTRQKLALFRSCFMGLPSVYGTYDSITGRVCQVKELVTDQVLLHHLKGVQSYGVYLLIKDRINALAVDFDKDDLNAPMEFVCAAKTYGLSAYIERSKAKGFHAWMFFEQGGVLASKARRVAQHILDEVEKPNTEIFPKQDKLDTRTRYGNFINAPLFGTLVPHGRTVFLDETNPTLPCPDQWELLENVQRASEILLDDIIEINDLIDLEKATTPPKPLPDPPLANLTFGLPPCARKMLTEGVTEYQRVSCFRLAGHLKKAGLPQDIAIAGLNAWATKNRPKDNKRIITEAEILEQTNCAYEKSYRGCGCEEPAILPYCQPECPLQKHDQASRLAGISK